MLKIQYGLQKKQNEQVNYRKPIIPVQIEEVKLNEEFEMYISTDQIVAVPKIDHSSPEIKKLIQGILLYISQTLYDNKNSALQMANTKDISCSFQLKRGSLLVGKDQRKCNVYLDDSKVSNIHAIIDVSDKGIAIKDLNTTNGTIVNSKRIAPNVEIQIHANDTLQFGDSEFVVVYSEKREEMQESTTAHLNSQSIPQSDQIGIGTIIGNTYKVTVLLGCGAFR